MNFVARLFTTQHEVSSPPDATPSLHQAVLKQFRKASLPPPIAERQMVTRAYQATGQEKSVPCERHRRRAHFFRYFTAGVQIIEYHL
ncbi:MAG: hypothetical protein WKG07_38380 [Hymenobacter sp.]